MTFFVQRSSQTAARCRVKLPCRTQATLVMAVFLMKLERFNMARCASIYEQQKGALAPGRAAFEYWSICVTRTQEHAPPPLLFFECTAVKSLSAP